MAQVVIESSSDKKSVDNKPGSNFKASSFTQVVKDNRLVVAASVLIVAVFLLFLGGRAIYRHIQLANDTKVNKEFTTFMANNTDCSKYLDKFGHTSAYRSATKAELLESDVTCSLSNGNNAQATNYLNKLQAVYSADTSVTRYIDIAATRDEIKQLQSHPNASSSTNNQTKAPISQNDGAYSGP